MNQVASGRWWLWDIIEDSYWVCSAYMVAKWSLPTEPSWQGIEKGERSHKQHSRQSISPAATVYAKTVTNPKWIANEQTEQPEAPPEIFLRWRCCMAQFLRVPQLDDLGVTSRRYERTTITLPQKTSHLEALRSRSNTTQRGYLFIFFTYDLCTCRILRDLLVWPSSWLGRYQIYFGRHLANVAL